MSFSLMSEEILIERALFFYARQRQPATPAHPSRHKIINKSLFADSRLTVALQQLKLPLSAAPRTLLPAATHILHRLKWYVT